MGANLRAGLTRRAFIPIAIAAAASALTTGYALLRRKTAAGPAVPKPDFPKPIKPNELEAANDLFLHGQYAPARSAYQKLVASGQISPAEGAHSAALCSFQLGDYAEACRSLSGLTEATPDDWRLIALANARCGNAQAAIAAFDHLSAEDASFDTLLCEEIAMASARTGDNAHSWQFYRAVEQADPAGPAIQRLTDSGQFSFTRDFFGYGTQSLLNYGCGIKNGAIDWGNDALAHLWHFIRHPVDSMASFKDAVGKIFSRENLDLLLSPTLLASRMGTIAARVYWSAWESCKISAAREYALDLNDFAAQQTIHEIAAGRMVGYVAPDLILLVLSGAASAAAKAVDAEKVVATATLVAEEVVAATAQAEQGIEKANLVARSATFLEDVQNFPALQKIAWLKETTWEIIKACPRLEGRLDQVAGWMSDIRHIPGAKALVETMAARLHLSDEGYLFQLERAAEYARKGELESIGTRFYVDVALPGKPVRRMCGEADLALKDGTLVETKYRSSPLTLDEALHTQLQKYNRAVEEGQFKRIRLECNNAVTKSVRDRCSVFPSQIEIVENVKTGAIAAVN